MASEDEAYEPWQGCYMDTTGCHYYSYYSDKYAINESLWNLFNLDCTKTLKLYQLEKYFINFIRKVEIEPVHIFSTKLDTI